ncbi:hypothetical protein [Thermoflexus sp.]|uniref:hypothetical protein n=1 Tax=Thermoflexus sp. TaxID=1969742 RepID=UPI0025E9E862|nr:hypothetical protein [Thermoflexus sp.]MDW8179967.1 hypothetical protein [Anaerolineae bacterium]MCS6962524.1 hypothetical protein [Thermoflexus sp.]MCS7350516.1 hypothetical protein [Thermoflexus sp.]MCX7690311.1 hypothetical protein [Thermoflexus sp.]MDW8183637.1 hypothetical protein [Anaerolineae bacterium]
MYPESEILFPPRCIPLLAETRGKAWRALVRRVARLPEEHPDTLALSLTVIRLAGCLTCDMDSYRASLGCAACSQRAVAGFKGTDEQLIHRFEEAREEIEAYLNQGTPLSAKRKTAPRKARVAKAVASSKTSKSSGASGERSG